MCTVLVCNVWERCSPIWSHSVSLCSQPSSLSWCVGPADRAPWQLHVSDQRLDGRLAHQPHEEELGDEAGWHGTQSRETQQQAAKALRLVGVLQPLVLCQGNLCLFLQGLYMCRVSQTTGIWKAKQQQISLTLIITLLCKAKRNASNMYDMIPFDKNVFICLVR